MDAVIALYRPTPAGIALLRSLDVRQMRGEPGFFGSYGFNGWAGIGEAKPVPTMHELMHSYWGGFPVIGRPGLGWEQKDGNDISAALASYHRDILTFMAQPPDEYELLRQRLRNLPGLSSENTEPLFHSLEADIPYTTGGDLGLVPPILRRYWGYFLDYGPFHTWERAGGWFQALSHEQRTIADKFLGFQHLDLRKYASDLTHATPDGPLAAALPKLAEEERQRLTDLAEQFDLLLGDAQLEENFQFWRGYLQDKVGLHRAHPQHLGSLDLPRAIEIAAALDFLINLDGRPEGRASILKNQIEVQPFLANFLPAVDNRTLVALFARQPYPARRPHVAGHRQLRRASSTGSEPWPTRLLTKAESRRGKARWPSRDTWRKRIIDNEQDLRLFFDLFHDSDPPVAHRVMAAVDKQTVSDLMPKVPVQLRTLLSPERLLEKMDITGESTEADLRRGVELLLEEASGNYRIDEPFLERLFDVLADRFPREALRIFSDTAFPLEGMILHQPAFAAAALSGDINASAELVESSDAVVAPPARIIYRLISADPELAATLLISLEGRGQGWIALESLSYLAYDKSRTEKYPQLAISLAQDGAFLNFLVERQGEAWLHARLSEAVALYSVRAAIGEVEPDFLIHYRDTLEAAADTLGLEHRGRLMEIIRTSFA